MEVTQLLLYSLCNVFNILSYDMNKTLETAMCMARKKLVYKESEGGPKLVLSLGSDENLIHLCWYLIVCKHVSHSYKW